ncbi:MAG TPA: shikimate dehydrogenase [Solirubrobacteraceae bacterium]|nr:shikimate dehydrogenase [Solirubrobacteraceae bacterium]
MAGWPVGHSRSPAMHNAALAQVGLRDWRYQLLPLPPELFGEAIAALPGAGFRGINVTIPHKQAALARADRASSRAAAIGAANTLLFGEGGVDADNTDGPALVAELPVEIAGASALVLGAGGSARAAVWALLDAGADEVRVYNRTHARARALCAELGGTPVEKPGPADILVNCTPAGLVQPARSFEELPIAQDEVTAYGCVVDLVYATEQTALIREAHAREIPTVAGLELLVAQGALSFELFTGRPAPIETMRAAAGAPLSCGPR